MQWLFLKLSGLLQSPHFWRLLLLFVIALLTRSPLPEPATLKQRTLQLLRIMLGIIPASPKNKKNSSASHNNADDKNHSV